MVSHHSSRIEVMVVVEVKWIEEYGAL